MVTLTDWLTALETALNPADVAPVGTTTVAGTLSAALLLVKVTVVGLLAAALRDTVHASDWAPVSDVVPHEIVFRVGAVVEAEAGFSVITSVFVTLPSCPEMVTLTDWLTALETALNPVEVAPVGTTTVAGTVSAALLLVRVTVVGLLAAALRDTVHASDCAPVSDVVPHEIVFRVGAVVEAEAGSSVSTSVFVTLPSCPEMVTLTDWLTALETALNPAEVAPVGTTTVDGTLSAALLLVRVTVVGLLAAALRDTVHAFD
jgi:hypothetical protein